MSDGATTKMALILKANDGKELTVEEDVAFQSNLLKKMVLDLGLSFSDGQMLKEPLPVTNVDGWALEKIIEWCTTHRGDAPFQPKKDHEDAKTPLTEEDKAYLDVNAQQLHAILMGANYLDIPGLIDIITQKIADMSIGKSVEEIREIYGLVNDFTPEEEAEIKKRFEWIEG